MAAGCAGIGSLLAKLRTQGNTGVNTTSAVTLQDSDGKTKVSQAIERASICYNFGKHPTLLSATEECFNTKEIKSEWVKFENNYIISVEFNEDGTALSTTSQDRVLRIFKVNDDGKLIDIDASYREGGFIYDTTWNPVQKNLIATTSHSSPIRIYDCDNEKPKSSLKGINALDELEHAYSLAFSNDGDTLYAGYKNCVRLFDVEKSSKQVYEFKTYTKAYGGQKGIICGMMMKPQSDTEFAVASFGNNIGFYSNLHKECQLQLFHEMESISTFKYSPDGIYIYIGGRKGQGIACYDTRMATVKLYELKRECTNHQRLNFDITGDGNHIISGNTDGNLSVYDLKRGEDFLKTTNFKISNSTVVSVSLHPTNNVIASGTGQRIFPLPVEMEDSDYDGDEPVEMEKQEHYEQNILLIHAF
uniref:WD_REPEATS_REGION domain-containing protein n=1 Tax=Rhabditophanes sp. KR3021 TaxID=114890 RepID=A0AC35UGR4_9BILA